ncbi:MAG: T9SS type A sorting domain-containing protein [Flavobacteriales bacterium]|nr:T9SS type A sorting domain-containing protein [Flavobacteriales bacterium]
MTSEIDFLSNIYFRCSSFTVNVDELTADKIQFANPVCDELSISGQFDEVSILSLSGQVVLNQVFENVINVSILEKGIYLIRIEKDGQTVTKKLVKG